MFSKTLLFLLPLLPLLNAVPVPAPLLGLDSLPVVDSILDPLVHPTQVADPQNQDSALLGGLPILSQAPGILNLDNNKDHTGAGGLIDTLLDTVESITGPLNISLNANVDLLGINTTLGLNIDLSDNEELICGPVIGYWSEKQYNIPCVCWSQDRGIVIDAQLEVDLGMDEVNGLDTFLQAQIQFGGKRFTYPAYSMPTCDGDGGFTCPGGYSSNGKCSKFLAAKPRPRILFQSTPTPTSGPTEESIPTATDLIVDSVPPTTMDGLPTSTASSDDNSIPNPTITASPIATIASPDQSPAPNNQAQVQAQAQPIDEPISIDNVALVTSTSTSTIILPATVFVEMMTTTQPMTIWATQTETQTQTQIQTQTVTSTSIQTQWATTTMTNCGTNDENLNVNSVPQQQTQNTGYTPPISSFTPTSTSATSATGSSTLTSSSDQIEVLATPTSTSQDTPADPAPTPAPASEPAPEATDDDVDDDAFTPPPRVIRLAHPQAHSGDGQLECSNGEEFKQTMCCRVDQVEVDGECKCDNGFENVLNLNICLSICLLGERLPSGECSSLGLGLNLDLGLGDLSL